MRRMWEIKNQTATTLDLYIYGEVKGDSYDWWTDEVIESPRSLVIPEAANREISATVVLKRMLEAM